MKCALTETCKNATDLCWNIGTSADTENREAKIQFGTAECYKPYQKK